MTIAGGDGPSGGGTIFRMQTDGTGFDVIHTFLEPDGRNPYGSLLLSGSSLYGLATTADAGSNGVGTLFRIGTDGQGFEVLHAFQPGHASYPYGSLIQIGSKLYGVTKGGGTFDSGTVFSFDVPEPSGLTLFAGAAWLVMARRTRAARGQDDAFSGASAVDPGAAGLKQMAASAPGALHPDAPRLLTPG